jgi:hypothetical protein
VELIDAPVSAPTGLMVLGFDVKVVALLLFRFFNRVNSFAGYCGEWQ